MRPGTEHCIAVVDVETTGLSPWRHDRVVEIAVVLLGGDGEVRREYETLVNPGRDIGPTSIHGITARDVLQAPSFADIAGDLVSLLRSASVLAGHNISFDRNFLIGEFQRLSARFPELPMMCTCRLMGRQSLKACCRELGVALDGTPGSFHSALFDARATAEIITRLLEDDAELLPVGRQPIAWPDLAPTRTRPVTRRVARQPRPAPVFLQRLAARGAHDTEAASPHLMTYLALLDRVLEDRVIDEDEEAVLLETIDHLGLSAADVSAAHERYLEQLAALALADDVVTDAERRDLETVCNLLGRDIKELDALLQRTRRQLDASSVCPSPTEDLSGKSVCFTGELQSSLHGEPLTRPVAQRLAERAGLVPVNGVTKKLDLLVVADPDTQSGKARKARRYGTRIVAEKAFWRMIGVAVA